MKKIFLHLGHGKTGTTSIQAHLFRESSKNTCNVLYPNTCRIFTPPAHHELFRAGLFPESHWQKGKDQQMCNALYQEIEDSHQEIVILSSETGLASLGQYTGLNTHQILFFEKLINNHKLQIVYYVRNQFEQIESAFYTFARTHQITPNEKNFKVYLTNEIEQFDYWKNIELFWSNLVGAENILSKTYHKTNIQNGDIVQDFLSLIGIFNELWPGGSYTPPLENITPEYQDPNNRGKLMSKNCKSIIKEKFSNSNEKYAEKYLDEQSGKLLLEGFL